MPNDFEKFQEYFREYQNRFGLNGWQVFFRHRPLAGSYARCHADKEGMVVTVSLDSKTLKRDQPWNDVKKHAKHEALHLLLARFSCEANARCASKDELYTAEEDLVNNLMGLIE